MLYLTHWKKVRQQMTDIDDLKKCRFCLNLGRYLMAHNPQLAEYQLHMLKKTLNLGDEVKKEIGLLRMILEAENNI